MLLVVPQSSRGFHREMQPFHARGAAFTLVEIMVSTSILVLIMMLVNQLVNSAAITTINAGKLMDSDSQARLIFAKMAEDFAAMYKRTDLNYYFLSQSGNDTFYFYSQAPGHIASQDPAGTGDTSLTNASLVGYRVSDTVSGGTRVELERLGRGLHWIDVSGQTGANGNAASVLFLPSLIKDAFSTTLADPYNNSSNANASPTVAPQWDVIGDQVFRMEFCFLLVDGTFSVTPILTGAAATNNLAASSAPGANADSTAGYSIGSRWYDRTSQIAYCCTSATAGAAVWTPIGLGDVKAVVVTIALIDTKSRASTTISAIEKAITSNYLPDASTCLSGSPSGSMATTWVVKVNDAAALARNSGLSLVAASSVRVYERFFYLN